MCLTLFLSKGFSWKEGDDDVIRFQPSTTRLQRILFTFSLLTIILWTVLNIAGPVAHALALAVLPSILWDRVVALPHRILNSSTTRS